MKIFAIQAPAEIGAAIRTSVEARARFDEWHARETREAHGSLERVAELTDAGCGVHSRGKRFAASIEGWKRRQRWATVERVTADAELLAACVDDTIAIWARRTGGPVLRVVKGGGQR